MQIFRKSLDKPVSEIDAGNRSIPPQLAQQPPVVQPSTPQPATREVEIDPTIPPAFLSILDGYKIMLEHQREIIEELKDINKKLNKKVTALKE